MVVDLFTNAFRRSLNSMLFSQGDRFGYAVIAGTSQETVTKA